MKKTETSLMLETYKAFEDAPVLNYHKCWDIEGKRQIARYNLVLTLLGFTFWLSFRIWNANV